MGAFELVCVETRHKSEQSDGTFRDTCACGCCLFLETFKSAQARQEMHSDDMRLRLLLYFPIWNSRTPSTTREQAPSEGAKSNPHAPTAIRPFHAVPGQFDSAASHTPNARASSPCLTHNRLLNARTRAASRALYLSHAPHTHRTSTTRPLPSSTVFWRTVAARPVHRTRRLMGHRSLGATRCLIGQKRPRATTAAATACGAAAAPPRRTPAPPPSRRRSSRGNAATRCGRC